MLQVTKMSGYMPYEMKDFITDQKMRAEKARLAKQREWTEWRAKTAEQRAAEDAAREQERMANRSFLALQ